MLNFKTVMAATLAAAVLAGCAVQNGKSYGHAKHQGKHMVSTRTVESQYGFDETVTRLQNAVKEKGMNVFAVIDHQEAARQNGLSMQPAKVIVFGTPKAGTPLMVKDPAFALQLPLRVLVTEIGGHTQVVYNDTHALVAGSKIDYAEVENTLANAEKLIRKAVVGE